MALNGFSGEVSNETYFAPQRGLNSFLGQANLYVVRVVDGSGNPIEGATVTCTNNENSDTHSFVTDANGEALFEPFVEWGTTGINGVEVVRWIETNVTITATGFSEFNFSYQTAGQGDYRVVALVLQSGMMTKLEGVVLVDDLPRAPTNDTCYCLLECEYREYVFTDTIGSDHWKNDKSTFLQRKVADTDSIVFELWKSGDFGFEKLTDITTNAYGTFYPTFQAQPKYLGLEIEWFKVWQVHGFGNYQIRVSRTILGKSDQVISRIFHLGKYSDRAANNTVVIESYQTGNVLSSDFDYTGLLPNGWLQQWRVRGNFGAQKPSLDTDRLEDSNRNIIQIQDKIRNEYTLDIHSVTADIFDAITQDAILGNVILITDFQVLAPKLFRRISVLPTAFEDTIDKYNRRIRTSITMTDSVDNRVKRNF